MSKNIVNKVSERYKDHSASSGSESERMSTSDSLDKASETFNNTDSTVTDKANSVKEVTGNIAGDLTGSVLGEDAGNSVSQYVNEKMSAYTGSLSKADVVINNPNATTEQKAAASGLAAAEAGLAMYGQVTGFLGEMSDKMMMPVMEQLAKFKGEAILPIAKQLDPVLGLDLHFYLFAPVPLPNPYIGLLFRPADFISCALASLIPTPDRAEAVDSESSSSEISAANAQNAKALAHQVATMAIGMMGATVKIGGFIPRVTAGTPAINIPHEIMPIFGPLMPYPFRNKGHAFLGSLFVVADGAPLTGGYLHLHNDCWDIGIPSIHSPMDMHLYVPSGIILPIPWNTPILVNPIPTPINPLTIFDRIFRGALSKLGKNKKPKPPKQKPCNRLSKKLHALNDKLANKFPNLSKKIKNAINTYVGHPIGVADGVLFTDEEDFSLPGPIPLSWERIWYSDSQYQGPLGSGWHHSYDWGLQVHPEEQFATLRMEDGRTALFDQIPLTHTDAPRFNRTEKIFLHKHQEGFYYAETANGLLYNFSAGSYGERKEHKLTSIANRNGYAIRFEYDSGILSKIVDSSGRILTVETQEGKIVRITTPSSRNENEIQILTQYNYDEDGNMTQQVNTLGESMYFEYKNHLLVKETWRNGVPYYFRYEGTEVGAKCVETWGEGKFLHYRLNYQEGKTITTDSLGNTTIYFHKNGIVYNTVDPEGNSWTSVFNEFDEIEGTENPLGQISGSTYDELGNLLTLKKEDGSFIQLEYTDPDSPFFPTEAVDSRGGKWKWHYDLQGNLLKKVNPEGAVTQFKYTDGLITTIINPDQTETLLEYDSQYNLSKITFPNGTHEEMFYDLHGRNIKQVDVQGNYIFRDFDDAGRVKAIALPDGNRKKMEYDAMDNLIRYQDNQYKVSMEYNVFNKLKTRKQGNTQLEFTYNAEGQLKQIVNEKQETYNFLFDKNGRVKEETSFDGLRTRYRRDAAGKVLAMLKGEKRKTQYEYDSNGFLQRIQYHDGLEEFFEYEKGMLSGAYSTYARVNFERDALGRIIKEISDGHEVTSSYNLMGDRIHIGSSLGADIHLDYDTMGNLISQKTHGWEADRLRDTYGLEIERNLTGGISSRWERDKVGRISQHSVTHRDSLGIRTRYRRSYHWDTNYKLRQMVDQNGQATSFEYDVYGNLSKTEYADGTVQFRKPDETGNLFETPERNDRLYGKGGKLLKTKNARYEYDEAGNLIKKTTREGEWLYEWHGNGTLRRVRRPDGQDVWFRYDPLGRRTAKKFKSTTTRWVWDGNKPLHEWKEFEAREATPEELTTWVFDEDSFVPVAKLRGNKKYSILADHLGTPVQGYSEDGSLLWEREFDSYGRIKMSKGEEGFCPFAYQGQIIDKETGLYYNRFRYYSPEEGLYISQDPIGLQGGDRFYGYVKDPNTWIDPLGLASKTYGKDDLNVDTGTARAIMDGSSHDIDSSIKDKNLIMTQTAVDELNAYGERSNRKQEVQNFLDSNNVNIVPDNPSDRAKNLPTTRKIGDNDKIIFGTGDSMGITTITSDAKFVSASSAHGVDFDVIVHSPVSTTK